MREFHGENIPRPRIPDLLLVEPLDLEIGAGQGLHAVQYCGKNPTRTLLAIERTEVKYSALRSRVQNHPAIGNLIALRADAVSIVSHFLKDESIENVFLLYPNPYPKNRQANQRWHRSPFIRCLHRKMKALGRLHLATNLKWYADEAESWLKRDGLFTLQHRHTLSQGHVPRTHFERKYLERGETCFDLVFERSSNKL